MKLCPHCRAELVWRDTYALPGGDETYLWCLDCERVIEQVKQALDEATKEK